MSRSDVGYIPRAYVKEVSLLLYILRNADFAIAIPTACHLASTSDERQYFSKPLYLWYDDKREHPTDFIDGQTTFLHPIKYSILENQVVSFEWLRQLKKEFNGTSVIMYCGPCQE